LKSILKPLLGVFENTNATSSRAGNKAPRDFVSRWYLRRPLSTLAGPVFINDFEHHVFRLCKIHVSSQSPSVSSRRTDSPSFHYPREHTRLRSTWYQSQRQSTRISGVSIRLSFFHHSLLSFRPWRQTRISTNCVVGPTFDSAHQRARRRMRRLSDGWGSTQQRRRPCGSRVVMRGIVKLSHRLTRRSTSSRLSHTSYLGEIVAEKASFDRLHTFILTRSHPGNVDFITTKNEEYCDLTMNLGQSLWPWSRTATTTVSTPLCGGPSETPRCRIRQQGERKDSRLTRTREQP
jgi:hypothetical protein